LAISLLLAACTGEQKQEAPVPNVKVLTVEPRSITVEREWIGTLDGSANVEVRTRVQGYITAITIDEGSSVEVGTPLVQIDPLPLEAELAAARADLAKSQATQGRAQLDEQRQAQLFKSQASSRQDYDNAVQNNLATRAAVQAAEAAVAQATLNLQFATITSPIAGIVGRTDFTIGGFVPAGVSGVPVTTISTVDPIKFVFSLSEKDYLAAADKLNARMDPAKSAGLSPLLLIRADGTLHSEPGRLIAVGREVDTTTGTIEVTLHFPNPGKILRPGQFARLRLAYLNLENAVVVPQRAVQELQGKNFVWTVDAAGLASQQPVTVGPRVGSDWVIEQGLKPGDRYVVEGVQSLRDGITVKTEPYQPTPEEADPAPTEAAPAAQPAESN
jgi:membrane fusion protein (multidrug efflux system)